jgi:two-component system, cell cycle response regulator DivK
MKHRMLVVEDNGPNRELLCDWLQAEGFEVSAAEDLERAFAEFKNQPPVAVLLDVQLGREDGLTLAAWMRREPKLQTIPVIAVTAHAMVTDQERVMQAGCNACISKPVDFQLLREQLQHCLTIANVFQRNVCDEEQATRDASLS